MKRKNLDCECTDQFEKLDFERKIMVSVMDCLLLLKRYIFSSE